MNTTNPREAAFLALTDFLKTERYLSETLKQWKEISGVSQQDFHLAEEITYGSCRRLLSLQELARQAAGRDKLKLKVKEKALLYTALYQHVFMDSIPLFAIGNETVALAKKHCHRNFVGFLNAVIRKLEDVELKLPEDDSNASLSLRYSLPLTLVEKLVTQYGLDQAKEVFQTYNTASKTTVRLRSPSSQLISGLEKLDEDFAILIEPSALQEVVESPDYYIQNPTPYNLIGKLSDTLKTPPKSVADLCAAPGGKSIAIKERFPDCHLLSNDISDQKVQRLKSNLDKYGIEAEITTSSAEKLQPGTTFDLIILDLPCSNTGVLNKRPEARWRVSEESLEEIQKVQKAIIKHAYSLLNPGGHLFLMTCSILPEENENLSNWASKSLNLTILQKFVIIPSIQNLIDGGYGCSLQKI